MLILGEGGGLGFEEVKKRTSAVTHEILDDIGDCVPVRRTSALCETMSLGDAEDSQNDRPESRFGVASEMKVNKGRQG